MNLDQNSNLNLKPLSYSFFDSAQVDKSVGQECKQLGLTLRLEEESGRVHNVQCSEWGGLASRTEHTQLSADGAELTDQSIVEQQIMEDLHIENMAMMALAQKKAAKQSVKIREISSLPRSKMVTSRWLWKYNEACSYRNIEQQRPMSEQKKLGHGQLLPKRQLQQRQTDQRTHDQIRKQFLGKSKTDDDTDSPILTHRQKEKDTGGNLNTKADYVRVPSVATEETTKSTHSGFLCKPEKYALFKNGFGALMIDMRFDNTNLRADVAAP